jgi:hypothetical protein
MHSMKRPVFAGLLLLSACAGAALSRVVVPPAHAQATRRWEHFCFSSGWGGGLNEKELNAKLTDAGREGWELVSVAVDTLALYCMKRPAP